ncbi:Ankyrin repeat domain-containing protein 55 [Lecanora helva]
MSDPLSSVASVFTLAENAAQSVKVLVSFFRDFKHAPIEVHEWLILLESLKSAFSALELYGSDVDSERRFSPHFRQRLASCVAQLQRCTAAFAKIHAELSKGELHGRIKWDRKARRSWERAKWAMFGGQKMRRVMDRIQLYHVEIGIELLRILAAPGGALPPSENTIASSKIPSPRRRRLRRLENTIERSPRRIARSVRSLDIGIEGETGMQLSTKTKPDVLSTANGKTPSKADMFATASVNWSHELVKRVISIYCTILGFKIMIRAGPVVKTQSSGPGRLYYKRHQQVGLGLILSTYFPRFFISNFGSAICGIRIIVKNDATNPLIWSLNFPTVVPADGDIFRSVRSGSTDNIKRLLSLQMASARDVTESGVSLLHSAANMGNLELVRLLIQEGADVNAQDEDGDSPLHSALVRSDNYEVTRTLLENGADLSSRAVDGKTPLHTFFNTTVSLVLMRDEWVEKVLPDSEHLSVAHMLAWSSRSTVSLFRRGLLYDHGDIMSTDNFGRTTVHFASSRGNVEILSYLLDQLSLEQVEERDNQGRTPFLYAAESSRATQVIDMLVAKGCDVSVVDSTGRGALHWAARCNNLDAVKRLMTMVSDGAILLTNTKVSGLSEEANQKRATEVYQYLREWECSKDLEDENSDPIQAQLCRKSFSPIPRSSLILEILGILSLIFLLLFGRPD